MDTSEGTEIVEQQESLDLIGNVFFLYSFSTLQEIVPWNDSCFP